MLTVLAVKLSSNQTCEISSAFSKLDFVAFQQQFNFIYYSTLNWLVRYKDFQRMCCYLTI
jgi:hypothetical protein